MSKYEDLKTLLFPNDASKQLLINQVQKKNSNCKTFDEACHWLFFKAADKDLQIILAPFLRQLAIQHLREILARPAATQPLIVTNLILSANEFQNRDTSETYLEAQAKNVAYAREFELYALGEALDVTLVVTRVGSDNKPSPGSNQVLLYTGKDPNCLVHLYNKFSTGVAAHYFIEEGQYHSTIGDGNCFYNGVAQNLRRMLLAIEPTLVDEKTISDEELDVYRSQYRALLKCQGVSHFEGGLEEWIKQVRDALPPPERSAHMAALGAAQRELARNQSPLDSNDSDSDTTEASSSAVLPSKVDQKPSLITDSDKGLVQAQPLPRTNSPANPDGSDSDDTNEASSSEWSLSDVDSSASSDDGVINLREFDDHLKQLKEQRDRFDEKVNETSNDRYKTSLRAISVLIVALEAARKSYDDKPNHALFKEECLKAIKQARPTLETHREWGGYWLNILLSVLSFGVLGLVHKWRGHSFFTLPTKTSKILSEVEHDVDESANLDR